MSRTYRPDLETLEERCTPTMWGNPWPFPEGLTLSFVPDATATGHTRTSNLFSELDQQFGSTEAWQLEILRGLQSWAIHTPVNIGLIEDNGEALGATGSIARSMKFGDIRIAGTGLPGDALALTVPFDVSGGTWAGDLVLNTAYDFTGEPGYDLTRIILHEAAHILGVPHSHDEHSAVHTVYTDHGDGRLTEEDIASIRSIYGARRADWNEGTLGNDTINTATTLTADASSRFLAYGDITTFDDVDTFRYTAQADSVGTAFLLRTSGVSLLTSKMTIFDSAGNEVGFSSSVNPLSGDLLVQVDSVRAGDTFFIQIEGVDSDVFSIGSYQVMALPLTSSDALSTQDVLSLMSRRSSNVYNLDADESFVRYLQQIVSANPAGKTFDTALEFTSLHPAVQGEHLVYVHGGTLTQFDTGDFYKITVPAPCEECDVLTVGVWALRPGTLDPSIEIYDRFGNAVEFDLLVDEEDSFAVQVRGAEEGETYYIRVQGDNLSTDVAANTYMIGVDVGSREVEFIPAAQGSLDANAPEDWLVIPARETHLGHYVLTTKSSDSNTTAVLRVRVFDANDTLLYTKEIRAGSTGTDNFLIAPGMYKLQMLLLSPDGSPLPEVGYFLEWSKISDKISPFLEDITTKVVPQQPAGGVAPTTQSSDNGVRVGTLPPIDTPRWTDAQQIGFTLQSIRSGESVEAQGQQHFVHATFHPATEPSRSASVPARKGPTAGGGSTSSSEETMEVPDEANGEEAPPEKAEPSVSFSRAVQEAGIDLAATVAPVVEPLVEPVLSDSAFLPSGLAEPESQTTSATSPVVAEPSDSNEDSSPSWVLWMGIPGCLGVLYCLWKLTLPGRFGLPVQVRSNPNS